MPRRGTPRFGQMVRAWGFVAIFVLCAAALMPAAQAVEPNTRQLTEGISVAGQIEPAQIQHLQYQGFRTIIDVRPDGEEFGQADSTKIQQSAAHASMGFAYVPVVPGVIDKDTVDAVAAALANAEKPVLIYCRSGRRAARVWALAEASRIGGLDQVQIQRALESAGEPVEDLAAEISARIAARDVRR
jgi:uncharacterized protein (TIGR01244 family)